MRVQSLPFHILISTFLIVKAQTTASSISIDNTNESEITFETIVHDYGSVNQGADGNSEFRFTNTGKEPLSERPYLNRWAAAQALTEFESKSQQVWIDPQHPEHHALNKRLPLREIVYSIVLSFLLIYFLWLGFRIGKK